MAQPRAAIEAALISAPHAMIPNIAAVADDRGQHLLSEIGFGVEGFRVSRQVKVDVGEPVLAGSRTWVPIVWHATGPAGLFPLLEGELELAPLGTHLSQLSMSVRYRPPLGMVGRTIDRALLSRVAEATIKDFVDRLAGAIEATLASQPAREAV